MADKEETVPEAEKENPNPVLVPPVDEEGNPIEPADPDADEDDDNDDDDEDLVAAREDVDRNDRGDAVTDPPHVIRADAAATAVPKDNPDDKEGATTETAPGNEEDDKGPLNLG